MATFTRTDDLQGAEFVDANLRGARFIRADLTGVVMRAVDVQQADIDAPFLFDGESFLRVNGVDVIPFVEAELNRRFPGRWNGLPPCRPARSTFRSATSGRARRRCGI